MKTVIFTDGSSRGNPGPGGWGVVIIQDAKGKTQKDFQVLELGGAEKSTTNNRMELTAAIEGLAKAPKDSPITLYSDSEYVIKGITSWIHNWKRNKWKTTAKKPVLNEDLWRRLDECAAGKTVHWKYIGGHSGIVGNERCDHIATDLADGMKLHLYQGPLSGYDLPKILDI